MVRTKFLDQGSDSSVAEVVLEAVQEAGYTSEEIIPGLIQAIIAVAETTTHPEECLDEAANLLADGPSAREKW